MIEVKTFYMISAKLPATSTWGLIINLTLVAIPIRAGLVLSLLEDTKAFWIALQQLYLASIPEYGERKKEGRIISWVERNSHSTIKGIASIHCTRGTLNTDHQQRFQVFYYHFQTNHCPLLFKPISYIRQITIKSYLEFQRDDNIIL